MNSIITIFLICGLLQLAQSVCIQPLSIAELNLQLIDGNVLIFITQLYCKSICFLAATTGNLQLANNAIQLGADVNTKDDISLTPLLYGLKNYKA